MNWVVSYFCKQIADTAIFETVMAQKECFNCGNLYSHRRTGTKMFGLWGLSGPKKSGFAKEVSVETKTASSATNFKLLVATCFSSSF